MSSSILPCAQVIEHGIHSMWGCCTNSMGIPHEDPAHEKVSGQQQLDSSVQDQKPQHRAGAVAKRVAVAMLLLAIEIIIIGVVVCAAFLAGMAESQARYPHLYQ